MKLLFSLLFFTTLIFAQEYPKFFATLGTPLYKADIAFQKLSSLDHMDGPSAYYHKEVERLLNLAAFLNRDPMHLEMNRKRYIQDLRQLQKEHDRVLKIVDTALVKSIDSDDYLSFTKIINADLESIRSNEIIHKRVMAYYVAHRTKGKLAPLEDSFTSLHTNARLSAFLEGYLPRVKPIENLYFPGGILHSTALSKDENSAFLAAGKHCFKTLDIQDETAISEIGSFEFAGKSCDSVDITLSSDGEFAFFSDLKNGFSILDVSQEYDPVLRGEFSNIRALTSAQTKDATISLVVRKKRGLNIIDVSNEQNPKILANYSHGLSLTNVMLDEKNFKVYLTHSKGLNVVDISIIGNPRSVGDYEVEGGSFDVVYSAKKKVLYLASGEQGIQVLDVSTDEFKLLSTYYTPTSAQSLLLNANEDILFVSALEGGVSEVDVSNSKYLKHIVTHKTKKEGQAFSAVLNRAENRLYISYGKAGLAIVKREGK